MDTTPAGSDQGIADETSRLDAALGAELRSMRAREGWSQDKLAELTGFNRKTIIRIEAGERPMSMAQLYRICKVFEILPSQLINAAEKKVGIQ